MFASDGAIAEEIIFLKVISNGETMLMEISMETEEVKTYQGNLIMIASLKDFDDEETKRPKSRTLSGMPGLYHDSFNRKRTRK